MLDHGHYRIALDQHGVDRRDMFSRFAADGVASSAWSSSAASRPRPCVASAATPRTS
ncbi:hypothetical protein ACFC5Z_14585 [Streptomyces sp. NPDC056004]|uniref:hypothetical protein n=1 Tax=unclassified Streptomyces TaxID=2593676 RepID=UPI0035D70D1F